MKHFLLCLIGAFIFVMSASTASATKSAEQPVGNIAEVTSAVSIIRTNGSRTPEILPDEAVFLGDVIETADKSSRVKIRFIDGTEFTMSGSNGSLTIDEYVFDTEFQTRGKARFSVLRGSFLFVSGLLGKQEKPDIKIDLDFGSIGIRGTKILRAMQDEECWIYLEEGAITVTNDAGGVDLTPGQGTRMRSRSSAPVTPAEWTDAQTTWMRMQIAPR